MREKTTPFLNMEKQIVFLHIPLEISLFVCYYIDTIESA
jgi:hypothetical protein